ncbi:MAG: hypothetical protein CVU38_21285 [Chloroflexi bacterium HGW-Chloroflexi-1]|nr:MAG: hypothetical protein CVU38_21285 [Chloroflexi bacterium HGW-Chloroflexi-1]
MLLWATIVVSASRSRRIAKSGGHGEDLAIPAEQMAQTKIIALLCIASRRTAPAAGQNIVLNSVAD